MSRTTWNLTTSRFALVAAFTAGLVAAPLGVNSGAVSYQTAAAQASDDSAGTDDATSAVTEPNDGAAEEFGAGNDPTPDVGGTGSPGVSSGEKHMGFATLNTNTPEFQEYSQAAERDDLEAAGHALSEANGDEEVSTDLVEHVNEELDVQTSLTAEQIAEAANEVLPY